MKKIFLPLTIPILLLSSCVVYYETADVRKNIDSNVAIASDNQAKTNEDYSNKLDTYQWLEGFILNKELEPFKSTTRHKVKMSKTYEDLRLKTNEIKALKMTFENLAKGKKKIKSNEDIWQEFKEIKKKMKSIKAEIDRLNPKYVSSSNEFANSISTSNFKILNKNELKTNIENNLSELSNSIERTNRNMKRSKRELEGAKHKINDSTYRQRIDILNQMDQLLSETEIVQGEITQALDELLNKAEILRNRDEIWTGPNTKTQKHVSSIQDRITQIKNKQAIFNKLALSLNMDNSE